MKHISYLAVLLFCLVVGVLATSDAVGAPAKKPRTAEIVAVPDTPDNSIEKSAARFRKEPPKDEGLHKLGEAPKKFVLGAGSFVLALIWQVFLILALVIVLITAVLYLRKRMGGEERGVSTLAKSFDEAVKAVRAKRKELQSQVAILAKRDAVTPAKKAKPRKKVSRAKKTS